MTRVGQTNSVVQPAAATPSGLDGLIARDQRVGVRHLAWLVMVLMGGFVAWAAFAQLDEVSMASGEVIPSAKVKVIQHLEGGIIQRLDVGEGALVKGGQVLVQLNLGSAGASREDLQVQLDSFILSRARLKSESSDTAVVFPAAEAERRPLLVVAERRTYQARQAELKSRRDVVVTQIRQRELEIKELQARQAAIRANLELVRERVQLSQSLLKNGLTPRLEHLELKREYESLLGEAQVLEQAVPRSQAALGEALARQEEEREKFRRRAVEELNKVALQIARVRETLSEASDRVKRTEIRSPIDGIVKNLRFNTIGGVVRPGEAIMEIVPIGDKLVIQARLSPVDRGYVQEGQKAIVKISTYDFVRYGGLQGQVAQIAADTNTDTATGQPYYGVIVHTERTYLGDQEGELPITPGMQAIVDINTGTRSVLNYLIKPVLKLRHEAFRER
jgi:adhesin transport system membrane fusion protein